MEKDKQARSTPSGTEPGAYWLDNGERSYTLHVNDAPVAIADLMEHTQTLLGEANKSDPLPFSVSVLESIERKFGLGAIHDVRLPGGTAGPPNWRDQDRASSHKGRQTPLQEARAYATDAHAYFGILEEIGKITDKDRLAWKHLDAARKCLRVTPSRLGSAIDLLRKGAECYDPSRSTEESPGACCRRAAAVLQSHKDMVDRPMEALDLRGADLRKVEQEQVDKRDITGLATKPNQDNPTKYVQMVDGPELEYGWVAKISLYPTPQGLDCGHVLYFTLYKFNDAPYEEAPDLTDEAEYFEWVKNHPPRFVSIAEYDDGRLIHARPDSHAASIIENIKERCADKDIFWVRDVKEMAYDEGELMPQPDIDAARYIENAYLTLEEVCTPRELSGPAIRALELLREALTVEEAGDKWTKKELSLVKRAEGLLSQCTDHYERTAGLDCSKGAESLHRQLLQREAWDKAIRGVARQSADHDLSRDR